MPNDRNNNRRSDRDRRNPHEDRARTERAHSERTHSERHRSEDSRSGRFRPERREHNDRRPNAQSRVDDSGAYVVGRRAVLELLKSDNARSRIEKIYVAHGVQGPQIGELLGLIRKLHLAHTELDRGKFRELERRASEDTDSQGVIALVAQRGYQTLNDILTASSDQPLLLIALDGVEDPHNVGAILRSAEAAGATAVLLSERRAALTPAVFKTSAGAANHIAIVKYGNLDQTIRELRESTDIQVIGLAGEGDSTIYQTDFTQPTLLITGSEEKGLHRLTRERCDKLVKIPLTGKTESLNASVATAVAMFEAIRQRG